MSVKKELQTKKETLLMNEPLVKKEISAARTFTKKFHARKLIVSDSEDEVCT